MSESRKNDHIDLSFKSIPKEQVDLINMHYEPLFSAHPIKDLNKKFLGYDFKLPLWVSSMTGGADRAAVINKNLALACEEFGMGMGLGSCRPLLTSSDRLSDFDIKKYMPSRPLFSNFGIAQLEELIDQNKLSKVVEINKQLSTDGLIVHVNPLQEWAQLEGDRYKRSAADTITKVCEAFRDQKIIVKEVGQGMGPASLKFLLDLQVDAIELAGFGGTNFTILEHKRINTHNAEMTSPRFHFGNLGHSAKEMISMLNELKGNNKTTEIIISGGIKDPVTAHVLMSQLSLNSVTGMASELLKYSMGSYEDLQAYLVELNECFKLANAYIK